MANLDNAFKDFDGKIKLSQSKKDDIFRRREAVRNKIRDYFKNTLKQNQPKFKTQGSFVMNTAINPLSDEEVDIDDGIYFKHFSFDEKDEYTPKEMHKIIINAVNGHTQTPPQDKTSCVRVIYAHEFHVDLPMYIMDDKNNHAYLAEAKSNEWILSDSKEFKDWFFKNRQDEQISRIVRYLKAWRDKQSLNNFASIALTILTVKNFQSNARDDMALLNTVSQIIYFLKNNNYQIKKPVSPYEDLWEHLSSAEKLDLVKDLESLFTYLNKALENESEKKASIMMQEQFGDRFPKLEDEEITEIKEYSIGAKPWEF